MILRLLSVEFLKIRRMLLWFLVLLGPFGVVGLQAVNFGLRYDFLVRNVYQDDLWSGLLHNILQLMLPAMFIGAAIVASMAAGVEHRLNVWKLTLALPVRRFQVFAAKFLLIALLLLASSTLMVPFTAFLGWALGFPEAPYGELLVQAYFPYLALLPFIALHTGLSVLLSNQAAPLTLGILGTVLSLFVAYFPDWLPWKWPLLSAVPGDRVTWPLAGIGLGLLLMLGGAAVFVRKDVM